MDNTTYNTEQINTLISEATKISSGVEEINQGIDSSYSSLDSRVQRKFADIFDSLNSTNRTLKGELNDVGTYGTWLGDSLASFEVVNENVKDLARDKQEKDMTPTVDSTKTGESDADKNKEYTINPDVIDNLPVNEQEVIKQKLKELGFTEEEIKSILDGKKSVDKAKLESLSTELSKIVSEHPEIRTELKALYGFDIFNEDGSVNKDKLALAMLMDGKDPNDKYDLEAFLKKYGLNGLTGGTGDTGDTGSPDSPAPETIIGAIKPGDDSDEIIINGINSTDITVTDGLLDGLDTENPDVLGTDTSLLAGAIGNSEGIVPKGTDLEVKKGSVGVGLGVAGLGGLAAAAGSIALAGKKKDEDEEENSDEISDVEILDGDDDIAAGVAGAAGIAGIIAAELALSEKDNKGKEEAKKEEEQKAFVPEAAIGEEFKPKKRDENDKSWLYGLGIGLAGAALASDDDEEEDEEEAF